LANEPQACPQTGGTLGCPHRQVIHTGVPVVENVREKIREVNEKSACKKVGSPDPMCFVQQRSNLRPARSLFLMQT